MAKSDAAAVVPSVFGGTAAVAIRGHVTSDTGSATAYKGAGFDLQANPGPAIEFVLDNHPSRQFIEPVIPQPKGNTGARRPARRNGFTASRFSSCAQKDRSEFFCSVPDRDVKHGKHYAIPPAQGETSLPTFRRPVRVVLGASGGVGFRVIPGEAAPWRSTASKTDGSFLRWTHPTPMVCRSVTPQWHRAIVQVGRSLQIVKSARIAASMSQNVVEAFARAVAQVNGIVARSKLGVTADGMRRRPTETR